MSLRPLSKELKNIAVNELNEDSNRIQTDLNIIREWSYQKPNVRIRSDQWLLAFLRGCKFNLELAKSKLDLLFTLKLQIPEFFSNRDPFLPEIQEILRLGICLPLQKSKDPTAPCIILFRFGPANPAKIRIESIMKFALMTLEILQNDDDNFVVCGGHVIIDDKGVTMKHGLQLTPTVIKNIFKCVFDANAFKLKGCHIINASRIVHVFFDLIKPFFNKEFMNVTHFYSRNNNDLYKTIPLSILPKEYGGDSGTLEELTNEWKQKVESYRDWFLDEEREAL